MLILALKTIKYKNMETKQNNLKIKLKKNKVINSVKIIQFNNKSNKRTI